MLTSDLKKDQELHGFTLTYISELTEINAILYQFKHRKTGARMVHVGTADDNNLFGVAFRTPPDDSTGVAHILEHTVLCGSKHYPVRDPFFSMLKRSLNTFMNAMTASDWTLYPFSSQNTKDFYNLMNIYLDAAFFPLLRERDFLQEGHRLDFAESENPQSPLLFKGVVYNEMKGAMADPSSLLNHRLTEALYPTTCYRHNSGGEPTGIPDLTWEQLKNFHATYYHPSNAYFFTYGNLPVEKHLAVIEQHALRHFSAQKIDSAVPAESRLSAPLQVTRTFPLAPDETTEKKSMVQLAWLTCDIADSFERLALNILSALLLGNSASPLYKALLDSKLGDNLAPGSGYHEDNRTTYFAVGLQGTDPENTSQIESLILATLEEVIHNGFSRERIEGVIHRLEFSHKEVTGDHYPYPLALLFRILGPWLHSNDPVSPLRFEHNLTRLRREISAGPFFENLIRCYLLDNSHRVTLTLEPDTTQKEREEKETTSRLQQIQTALSDKKKQQIIEQSRELQQAQEAEENLSCLPSLTLEDIPAKERRTPSDFSREKEQSVQWFDQPTNGIGYFTAYLSTDILSNDLLPYVPLFCSLLTRVGAGGHSYLEMAERMEAATGGIQAAPEILERPENLTDFKKLIKIKGKALIRNQSQFFDILTDLCTAPDFTDLDRLHTVIGQLKISLENSIPSSGHSYAARAAASHLTAAAQLRESWSGLTQIRLIKDIATLAAEELRDPAQKLQAIAQTVLNKKDIQCAITSEAKTFEALKSGLQPYLGSLPEGGNTSVSPAKPFVPSPARLGWATSLPVSYVTRVFRTVPYTHPDAPVLMVLAKLLRAGYLHREIREKGGAYGGMASYDTDGGLFSMLSYRDPQLTHTLKIYDGAIRWAVSGAFEQEQITEAILATFSDLDRPLSPGGKGSREFANARQGLTMAMRQTLRERALAVSREQLMHVAARYLDKGRKASAVSVVASEEALKKANQELGSEKLRIERI